MSARYACRVNIFSTPSVPQSSPPAQPTGCAPPVRVCSRVAALLLVAALLVPRRASAVPVRVSAQGTASASRNSRASASHPATVATPATGHTPFLPPGATPPPLLRVGARRPFPRRTLSDAGLLRFLHRDPAHPPRTWDLDLLLRAACYDNARILSAQTRFAEASAAVITAGMRPNPTLHLLPEIGFPWVFSVGVKLDVPSLPPQQRKWKVQAAHERAVAARLDVGREIWNLRASLHDDLVRFFSARRRLRLLVLKAQVRRRLYAIGKLQLSVGEVAAPTVLLLRRAMRVAQAALVPAHRACTDALAAVAADVGVPSSALRGVRLSQRHLAAIFRRPLTLVACQHMMLSNRLDIYAARRRIAAADADLRLELARRGQPFTITPSYGEGGNNLGLALAVPLSTENQNQGPIAQAVARRAAAQVACEGLVQQAYAALQVAWVRFLSARRALVSATGVLRVTRQQEHAAQLALAAGEGSLPTRLSAHVATIAALLRVAAAREQLQLSVGALENSVQAPLTGAPPPTGAPSPAGASPSPAGASRPHPLANPQRKVQS